MKAGENIRLRSDGRYEARYIKGRDDNGKAIYGYCYGKTYEDVKEKRDALIPSITREMNLLILGAGCHGQEVFEIAQSLRIFNKISFLDDKIKSDYVIGKWEDVASLSNVYTVAIIAVGEEWDPLRKNWTEKVAKLGYIIPTLIHPTAFIARNAEIGSGSVVCARATIASGCKIGIGSIIASGATLPRGTVIDAWKYYE